MEGEIECVHIRLTFALNLKIHVHVTSKVGMSWKAPNTGLILFTQYSGGSYEGLCVPSRTEP